MLLKNIFTNTLILIMDILEIIAMILISGIIAAGVSLPLTRYLSKPLFWILGIVLVCTYTLLVSKQCCTLPNYALGYTRDFQAIPPSVYITNAIIAVLYLSMALFCSYTYEKGRYNNQNFRKNLFLNRWFGLLAGGSFAIFLYCIMPLGNCGIFFSTVVSMFFPLFMLIYAFIVPFILVDMQK